MNIPIEDSGVEPTAYQFSMAVDEDGNTWVAGQDIVRFLRAMGGAILSADKGIVSWGDVAAVMSIEADALELRCHELTTEDDS